jgi:hypothetical protein
METITITVEGGMVQDVEGLPEGYDYEIVDNDMDGQDNEE